MELYDHQKKALDSLGNGKILRGGVGSGKTLTAVAYYCKNEAPRDVYVITTAKKRDSLDWEKEFAALGVGKYQDATVHGVLIVDSWNNIKNYVDVRDAFFIFDEQRVVGSGGWAKSFIKIAKSNNWILLSATPGDTWLDYIPVFVANGFYKNRTEFLREHVVFTYYSQFPKVDRYIGVGRLVRHRNNILVEMPFYRQTKRIIKDVDVTYDKDLLERVTKDRWNVYEQRPLRDIAELFSVSRRCVNSDLSRLSSVRQLMAIHPKLIVFYSFNYELEMLRTLLDESTVSKSKMTVSNGRGSLTTQDVTDSEKNCQTIHSQELVQETPTSVLERDASEKLVGILEQTNRSSQSTSNVQSMRLESEIQVAEWNGHKHEPIPTTDRWVYLVQYVAGSEGWNCIETNAVVFWSLTYSYKNWEQAFGRIDRLNTPFVELYYYVLQSDAWIDKAIRKSLQSKKNFNEAAYSRSHKEIA